VGTEELRTVRRQLDELASLRLQGPLSSSAEAAYRLLCQRERVLLADLEVAG
jgi:hypothetical protein